MKWGGLFQPIRYVHAWLERQFKTNRRGWFHLVEEVDQGHDH